LSDALLLLLCPLPECSVHGKMGKKPAPKTKAKAKAAGYAAETPAEPEVESEEKLLAKKLWGQRREASKWIQAKLPIFRTQLEAAKKIKDSDWLQIAHEFHEIKLIKLAKRLEEKTLDEVTQDFRDGIEAYLAQCEKGPVAEEGELKKMQDVWKLIPAEEGADYVRPEETSEDAKAAVEKLKAWDDVIVEGITKMTELMKANVTSAAVQEAGLVRIGWLYSDAGRGKDMASAQGLTPAQLMPAIEAAMKSQMPDPEVQRAGCAALRGIATAEGQLSALCEKGGVTLAVEAVRTHYKNKEVVAAGNMAFWAMAKAAGKNSPELSVLRSSDVPGVLKKCMDHHAWDQTLVGRIRVTLPFITED